MGVKNQVQLITYPDSLGGDLKTLNKILLTHFPDIFKGGIHILPPFPSSGDRGFAPLTYLEIEPKFGTWEDMRRIGENFDILLDVMVNHISRQSEYFKDFLKKGRNSKSADLFITLDKVWPDGNPSREELEKIFLRRFEPFSSYVIEETGETERVWTTFGRENPSEQIDIDLNSNIAQRLLFDVFANFKANNVKIVRLDAIGYIVKKPGTSCFFVEPEIYQYMDWITKLADSQGIELLPEVHAHYSIQFNLSAKGYWIYDFILPYTILEALLIKNSVNLIKYLKCRPHKQFTMLDCHDGIPLKPDLNDLYQSEDAKKIVNTCLERGATYSPVFSAKHKDADGFDVHQIRCAYYSVLDCDDNAYLAARAIQFFTPGIPQVYYVGLLAGENDRESAEKSGEGRDINRHNFSIAEIEQALKKKVVQRLLALIRFRNEYPAFNGEFKVLDGGEHEICLSWRKDTKKCVLKIDLNSYKSTIDYIAGDGNMAQYTV